MDVDSRVILSHETQWLTVAVLKLLELQETMPGMLKAHAHSAGQVTLIPKADKQLKLTRITGESL